MGCVGSWHPCSPWHLPLSVFRTRGESGGVNSLQQTFCVVRDPIQRAISQFSFQIKAEATAATYIVNDAPGRCDADSLNAHVHAVLGAANASFAAVEGEFPLVTAETLGQARTCVECAAVADCHWLPQWLYVRDTCDHVLRFESLEEDFTNLMKRFSATTAPSSTIPSFAFARAESRQVSNCNTLTKDDLDIESRILISRVYAEDFRQFGYDRPEDAESSALAAMLHRSPSAAHSRAQLRQAHEEMQMERRHLTRLNFQQATLGP